ncbi:MAG: DUF4125 family protein [Eubacteriales bacterium]|nr:DUF4125 family protein [Eubacteriales bacterium]
MQNNIVITEIVKQIVEMEWKLFDQVQNIGGRASCQDDRQTFFLMRSSQLMAWNTTMQESYYYDLLQAHRDNRNLLSEKYAYMMERTNPEEFATIRNRIPKRSAEKDAMIDCICKMHVAWQEELLEKYPMLAGQGRPIRKEEDTPTITSFETYLWGELATYSFQTIRLYAEYAERMNKKGNNLGEIVLNYTVAQYGYISLAEAEKAIREQRNGNI